MWGGRTLVNLAKYKGCMAGPRQVAWPCFSSDRGQGSAFPAPLRACFAHDSATCTARGGAVVRAEHLAGPADG